jgi:MtN3 and saliva related transmembrane protein
MELADIIGGIAATLTTVSFIPQVWHVWRSRNTQAISLSMYLAFTAGVMLWLVYGILLGALPIIIANGITVCLAGAVLLMKIRFG